MNRSRQSYLFAILAILFWSTIPTAFKICLKGLNILPMLATASLTSTVILFIILVAGGKSDLIRKSSARELIYSAGLGFVNPFVYYLILLKAYQLLPAQIAQPLNMIWPIILVFLSIPLLGQKIKSRSFIALFISFAGVFIISSQGNLFGSDHPGRSDIRGILLATGSSVFWAFYFILNVKDKRDETVKLFLNFFFGSVYLVVTMIIKNGLNLRGLELISFLPAVYIGLFEMGVTFLLWLKALQTATTTDKVSNLVYIAPFLSLVFIHFILNEPVYYTTPVGLLFIISGIWFQSHKPDRG